MSTYQELLEIINKGYAALAEPVQNAVVNQLVEEEVQRRAKQIRSGLDRMKELKRDLNKLRPDQVVYDAEGKVAHEGFTKARLEERKKLGESIERLEAAINKALAGETDKLGEVLQKLGKGGGEQPAQ